LPAKLGPFFSDRPRPMGPFLDCVVPPCPSNGASRHPFLHLVFIPGCIPARMFKQSPATCRNVTALPFSPQTPLYPNDSVRPRSAASGDWYDVCPPASTSAITSQVKFSVPAWPGTSFPDQIFILPSIGLRQSRENGVCFFMYMSSPSVNKSPHGPSPPIIRKT